MSAPAAGAADFGSGLLATTASVVRNRPAMEGGVLQSGAGHLARVGHTGGQQVFVGVGGGVEAFAIRQGADGVDDHVTGHAGVLGDLLDRASMARNTMAAPVASSPVREVTASVFSALAAA